MTRFAIFAPMKRASMLLALMLFGALPLFAQSTEFGVIVGGGRRFVGTGDEAKREDGVKWLDSSYSFSNSSVELFWAMRMDDAVFLKLKAGRLETEVAEAYKVKDQEGIYRRDAEGEVQHADAVIEYRFTEPYGTTAIFGGVGLYRQSGDGIASTNNFGWSAGVNSDFPLSRRYGIVVEASYHWSQADFHPRYLTLGGGIRIGF